MDQDQLPEAIRVKGNWETRAVLVNGEILSPGPSLKLRNHSPDGFNWGYGGSGPAQLSLALLLKFLPQEMALELYQKFKFKVVAGWPQGDLDIGELPFRALIAEIGGLERTREEIDKLKKDWRFDPIWDIEHTEGFERHRDELLAYRKECEAEWDLKKQERLRQERENFLNNAYEWAEENGIANIPQPKIEILYQMKVDIDTLKEGTLRMERQLERLEYLHPEL